MEKIGFKVTEGEICSATLQQLTPVADSEQEPLSFQFNKIKKTERKNVIPRIDFLYVVQRDHSWIRARVQI